MALHATDPATVFLSALARMEAPSVGAVEAALYEDRVLLRMLGMRRTVFVVPVELAPVVQASSTRAVAARERKRTAGLLEAAGVANADRWLREVEAATLEALRERGEATAAQLGQAEPRLRTQILLAEGKKYEARVNIATRVLLQLAADGRIVRARPNGSWISSQYRWSVTEAWLPGGLPEMAVEAAQVELVRRWLAAFGPGTVADLRWWTGWAARDVARALDHIGPVEVDLGGAAGLVLPGDDEAVPAPEPWAALLPGLDPTVMGWAGREWYLGSHGPALFDRSGNAGPTIWWDGRVVGGWFQRPSGDVELRLLEDVGADAIAAIETAAAEFQRRVGGIRVTPRWRTPLERAHSA